MQTKKKKRREKACDLSQEGRTRVRLKENTGYLHVLQENTLFRLKTEDDTGHEKKKKKKKRNKYQNEIFGSPVAVKPENIEVELQPVVSLENGMTESGSVTRDTVFATYVGCLKAQDTAEEVNSEEVAAQLSLSVKKKKKKHRMDRSDEFLLWDDDHQPQFTAGERQADSSDHSKGRKDTKKHTIDSTVAQYEDDYYSATTGVEENLLEISDHSHKKHKKKKKNKWNEIVGQDCSPGIITDLAMNALETLTYPPKKHKSKKNKERNLDFDTAEDALGFPDDLNVHSCPENETVIFHRRDEGFRKKKRRHDELMNVEELDCLSHDGLDEDQCARNFSTDTVPENGTCQIESAVPHTANKKKKKKKKHLLHEEILEEHGITEQEDSKRLQNSKDSSQDANIEACNGNASLHDEDSADPIVKEIKEYLPHLKKVSKGNRSLFVKHDLKRFRRFKEQGIPIKTGRFNKTENEKLRENVAFFLQASGIDTAEKLFYPTRFPEEHSFIRRLKKYCHFYEIIADGIPRLTSSILIRAQKVFDPNNYKGRYSKEETEKLLKYQAMYGNKWRKISALLERNWREVALRFSQLGPNIQNGPWSKAEIKRLSKAVKACVLKVLSEEDTAHIESVYQAKGYTPAVLVMKEKLYKGISWTAVAAAVGTRNWMQCKLKWNGILTQKMSCGKKIYQGWRQYKAKINMIVRVYNTNIDDFNDIDWEELTDAIGNVTPAYVQAKFYALKVRNVPNWQQMSFTDIVDYLYHIVLPRFEKKLEKYKKKADKLATYSFPQKASFFLNEIFEDVDDSENDEAMHSLASSSQVDT